MTNVRTPSLLALLALSLTGLVVAPARAANDIDQAAVNRAHDFLKTEKRGRDILSYVHFGSKYRGHTYKETRYVTTAGKQVPGHFALVYNFDWEDDGKTHVGFLCDARGNIYEVKVVWTNAVFNQPWLTANATIKVLGNLLIEVFKDKMSPADRREVQKLVDDANAKGMLEWSLKFQQALGR
jgi:hypothetical protein